MPSVVDLSVSCGGGSDVDVAVPSKSCDGVSVPECYLHWFPQEYRLSVWSRLNDEPSVGLLLRYLEMAAVDLTGLSETAGFVFDHVARQARVVNRCRSSSAVPVSSVAEQVSVFGFYRVVMSDGTTVPEVDGYGYVRYANRIHPVVFAAVYGPNPRVRDARSFMKLQANYRVVGDGAHPVDVGGVALREIAPDMILRDRLVEPVLDATSDQVNGDDFDCDGYCYLQLYPEDRRAAIAHQVGEWPVLAQLPSGRFPAADIEVVGRVLGAMALHCSGPGVDGSSDALVGYPLGARIGGGYSDTNCGNCVRMPALVGGVCSDCRRFSELNWRSEVSRAAVERFSGSASLAVYSRMASATCFFGGAEPCAQVLVLRDGFPTRWARVGGEVSHSLEPGLPRLVPAVDLDGRRGRVSVTGAHWAVQFERGTRVEFGPYDLWCRQPTVLLGRGRADFSCKFPYSGSWSPGRPFVIGFGLSRSAWVGALHTALGCDPTDATARLTSAVECSLYMSARFDRSRAAAQKPVPLREWVSHEGAVSQVACAPGFYAQDVGAMGVVIAARRGVVTVGDLVLSRRGSVCVLIGPDGENTCSWSCLDSETRVRGLPGSAAAAVALSRGRSSDSIYFCHGDDSILPDVTRQPGPCAVVMTVADTYTLDSGGPSSDGEGGYTFGIDF